MTRKKSNKKWIIKETDVEASRAAAREISGALGLLEETGRLLCNRGYKTPTAASRFIKMETEMLHDPYLLADMDKAVERIQKAINSGESIMIYGDYDVDGVTSVSMLYMYLRAFGSDVKYYIPNRIGEGYGVSPAAIERIAKSGVSLIITVDTGITANEEIELAKKLGVDVVVTDHHECRGDLPDACAVVNPCRPDCGYPFTELAGVGVVFKLVCALEERIYNNTKTKIECVRDICREYADLVALGTIADVMPIKDENRLIVGYGLKLMENTGRCGLAALIEASTQRTEVKAVSGTVARPVRKPKITSIFIGYTIAPRINAAGRISSAERAVELFLTESEDEAREIAAELCGINRDRQTEENRIAEQAYEKILSEYDVDNSAVIVLDADDWHHGVIGIVASRITEKFGLPSILISFEGADTDTKLGGDIGKGSGRSIKGINLVDALVYCDDLLVKYGGHELAAGLSVERSKVELFREKINEYVKSNYSCDMLIPTIEADYELRMDEINMRFAEEIRLLEPFGVSNPMPSFVMKDVLVTDIQPISGGKHTKLVLMQGERSIVAMCFSSTQAELCLYPGDYADILFTIDINEYNNQKTVQIIVRDIRESALAAENMMKMLERYEQIKEGAPILPGENVIPDRNDFVAVYTLIKKELCMGRDTLSHRALLAKLKTCEPSSDINHIKLKFIIKIMQELNIIGIVETTDEIYEFKNVFTKNKTDLEKSAILKKLRGQAAR